MISDKEYTQVDEFRLLCKTLRKGSTLNPLVGSVKSKPTATVDLLTEIVQAC
ncbi:hypothetical protein H6G96_23690 [Nostoc sp. FACHB-892]|uniref:hypothetical protein n=1 Tax=Nostoc sp. FACHB-892 TaxID=2692843 RepID=UPI001688ADC3|nr:hypothetical protein [Nostoc sp. FACHB-892]MBD2729237.1 hypothetical protein [Nostoc sp. FACHB-892]